VETYGPNAAVRTVPVANPLTNNHYAALADDDASSYPEDNNNDDASSYTEDDNHNDDDDDADSSATPEDDRSVADDTVASDNRSVVDDTVALDNRSVVDDTIDHTATLDNRSVDDDTVDPTMYEMGAVDVDDPNHDPRVRQALKKLADTRRQVPGVYTSNRRGPTTRSQRQETVPVDEHGTVMVTKGNPYITLDTQAWEADYGDSLGFNFAQLHGTPQYHVSTGLKLFGNRGLQAIRSEMEQFDKLDVIRPIKPSDLSTEERNRVLEYLMFLKEKRSGQIKGRGCADGRPQRLWTKKEDSVSPTVALTSLFVTGVIDAKEERCVATVDIPGAFLQTMQDELVHVRLTGALARMLCHIDRTKYAPYVVHEKGQPVLYARLNKALYGTLRAALQFYNLLTKVLTSWGFKLNKYDRCVANKMINGKQCTIVWHVDDLKISHVERGVVEQIIEDLNTEFGKHKPLTGKVGLVHEYLGMTLDYSSKGKLKIRMDDYTEKLLSECPEFFDGEAPTPAANNLFTVRGDSKSYKIPEDQADEFHRITAKLLFLSLRARPDILTAISFLCTRVSNPDIDDRHKLRRVIRYLRANPKLHLTLESDNVASMQWFVDASYGVHPDMRSHTGAVMTMGKGAVISGSNKQKLNTKSSTEAELVGVDDYMAKILSVRYFTEDQGYPVGTTTVHQDNQSTILLEKNGPASSSKRTRHINIRYFFVTDRVNKKEIKIEYCPTKEMVADFFTKPLQGCLFYKLRALILNMDA